MLKSSEDNILLRSHVLRMAMLSQRAVDYSIKAYDRNSLELCRLVTKTSEDLCDLEASIGDRGRALLAAGTPFDANSPLACSSLRIYSAFRVIFTAATEIAQNVVTLADGTPKAIFPRSAEIGNFVNGLVRLCSIAIFEQEMSLARQVLQMEGGRRKLDIGLYRARLDLLRRPDTDRKCELAIVSCIGQIAEQVYEAAEGIIAWLESRRCFAYTGTKTISRWPVRQHCLSSGQLIGAKSTSALTPRCTL